MLLVAMSRVKQLKDLHFVSAIGSQASREEIQKDSLEGVEYSLNKNSHWTEHVMMLLENLNYLKSQRLVITTTPRAPPNLLRNGEEFEIMAVLSITHIILLFNRRARV